MSEVTLVFPASHPAGIDYVLLARERGEVVVAASSERDFDAISELGEILHLPYVNDERFISAFQELKKKYGVSRVYAPAMAVFTWFKNQISKGGVATSLVGWSPVAQEAFRVNKLMGLSARYKPFISACSEFSHALSEVEIAANFRMANQIFGESNNDKIAAIMAVFCTSPSGDVVEIGSLAGKSVSVLNAMAKKYKLGPVLSIDPWMSSASEQLESPSSLRVDMDGIWEKELPLSFLLNMIPLENGQFNFLRLPSQQGYAVYKNSKSVYSIEFGSVTYEGRVSVIHIDGNHDYSHAKADCEAWVPLIKPLGWLILDDYVWAHGDGPQRAGDELLFGKSRNINRAFVCGKALFVQFAE